MRKTLQDRCRYLFSGSRQQGIKLLLFFKLCLVLCSLISFSASGQNQLRNIVPLSPNAAEISKYGEIPVNNFTGIPDIGVPLYTARSGELTQPLNLSYHAGGNKVEAQSSWVGLSWSIGVPMISRSVNGLPDEGLGGFITYRQNGYTVKQLEEQRSSNNLSNWDLFMDRVRADEADAEADAFSVSIKGFSGKFYYSQQLQKFVTAPISNLKISMDNTGFTVIGEDGTTYYFFDKETSSNGDRLNNITSSWIVSQVVNSSKTDTLSYSYTTETLVTRSLLADVKYQFIEGVLCPSNTPSDNIGNSVTMNIQSKALSQITFRGGRVVFEKQSTPREDLVGGYALDRIKVYNESNALVKQFAFNYKYLNGGGGGTGCNMPDNSLSNKWLLLTSVSEVSSDSQLLTHSFTYNEMGVPPCRNSPARDHWGYYNGVTTNTSLIPTASVPRTSPAIIIPGANREVNPLYSQFGILTQVKYPTGGFTTFEYENHKVNTPGVPGVYLDNFTAIEVEELTTWPINKVYTTTFSINNLQDQTLNQNNPNGGAYLKVEFDFTGVPLGNAGAQFRLHGTSSTSAGVDLTFSAPFQNFYVPNGDYQITATFNQDPPNYQNFFLIASWRSKDLSTTESFVGGLRVKEIKNFDNLTATPIVKKLRYTTAYDQTGSSGELFSNPRFEYFYELTHMSNTEAACVGTFMRLQAYSNQAQVSSSGSYIGYKLVSVLTDQPTSTGLTTYAYNHTFDVANGGFPFPPDQSMEAFRGQPIEVIDYQYKGGAYVPVKKVNYEYKQIEDPTLSIFSYKTNNESGGSPGELGVALPPHYYYYELPMNWSAPSKKTERMYDQQNATLFTDKITDYTYDSPYNQLFTTSDTNSDNVGTETKNFYPYNLSLTGTAETARLALITNNQLNVVLKQETKVNNQLSNVNEIDYLNFDSNHLLLPSKVRNYVSDPTKAVQISYGGYDKRGNLLEQSRDQAPKTSYLYSYNGLYPIAELKNADYAAVVTALGGQAAVDNFSKLTNPSKTTIDSFLAPLKLALPNAFMSSYTYEPLTGLANETDVKGMASSYTYDTFGRLENIKDDQGNIVKNFKYNYADGSGGAAIYYSAGLSVAATKNNCITGQVGSTLNYIVPAGKFTSTISQADANLKAQNDANANAQNYANVNGTCTTSPSSTTYYNAILVVSKIKNNCNPGQTGSTVNYTVAAGTYNSTISQADADDKALTDANANAQNYANTNGTCTPTYHNTVLTVAKIKNNCGAGQTGSTVNYTVAANTYSSTISQADANQKAQDDADANAQNYANTQGTCTSSPVTYYNVAISIPVTRNNCSPSQTGSTVNYTVAAGTYSSIISQDDADTQAESDVNTNAQSYANSQGICTIIYYSNAVSASIEKNDCGPGKVGSVVTYYVAAGAYTGTSQVDADQKAHNEADANVQSYANANGTCTNLTVYYSAAVTTWAYRNNCSINQNGSLVSYTVPYGAYTSTVNQADANYQAQTDANNNAQSYANSNGTCTTIYYNAALTVGAVKNNCGSGQTGTMVYYTVPAGTYSSTISQDHADTQAENDVNNNAQSYANSNGSCTITYYSTAVTVAATRNNCSSGQTGSTVSYTVSAGAYTSNISQADANQQAQNDANANAQSYANANGTCTTVTVYYSAAATVSATKNNCSPGQTGSTVNYTVAAGTYSSTISQADANQQAQNDANANAQSYANANGSCSSVPSIYYNTVLTVVAYKSDCGSGRGSAVNYTVAAGTYSSTISQNDADEQAENDVNMNAENYANTHGHCMEAPADFNENSLLVIRKTFTKNYLNAVNTKWNYRDFLNANGKKSETSSNFGSVSSLSTISFAGYYN